MADIDHVFARFHDDHAAPQPQRELLSIPRRGPSSGSRTVEVVHVRSGAPSKSKDQRPRESGVRAATWAESFPTKPALNRVPVELSAPHEPQQPTVHFMPMWESSRVDPEPTQPESNRRGRPRKIVNETAPIPADLPASQPGARRRGRPRKIVIERAPTTADPFNPDDDGTNCLRCGCLVQPARERRGLMTCATCG
jgi:hypothetical protein